jgi:hypothetical protein
MWTFVAGKSWGGSLQLLHENIKVIRPEVDMQLIYKTYTTVYLLLGTL